LSVEFIPREGKRCKLRRRSIATIGSALGGKIWTIESMSRHTGGESTRRIDLNCHI
jgi:hypothetical protein